MATCSNCRTRKVRCDGATPVCGQCQAKHKDSPCDYSPPAPTPATNFLLPKGEACIPCRKKKKKCTGERPVCTTCTNGKGTEECKYPEPEHDTDSIRRRNRDLEQRLQKYEYIIPQTPSRPPQSTKKRTQGSTSRRHVSFSADVTVSTHPRDVDTHMNMNPQPSHNSMPSTSSSITERAISPGSPDIPLASVISQRSSAQSSWSEANAQHMSAPAALISTSVNSTSYPAHSFTIPSQFANLPWQHQSLGLDSSLAHALSPLPPSHASIPSTSTFHPSAFVEPTSDSSSWSGTQLPSDHSQQSSASWSGQSFDLAAFLSSDSTSASQPLVGAYISPESDPELPPSPTDEWMPSDMAYDWAAWLDAPEPQGFITQSPMATAPGQSTSSYQVATQAQTQQYSGTAPPQHQQTFNQSPDLGAAWYNGQLVSGGLPNPGMVSSTAAPAAANTATPMALPQAQSQVHHGMSAAPEYMPPHYGFGSSPPAAVIQSSEWIHMPPIQYPVPSFAPGGSLSATSGQQQGSPMSGPNVNAAPSSSSKSIGPYDHIKLPGGPLSAECMTRDHQATLRSVFFKHACQWAIRLTEAKLNALADGDLSGTVIHPIFVHLTHLIGALVLRRDPDDSPNVYPAEELSYLTIILDILNSSALESIDPVYRVRAHAQLALYFFYKGDVLPARDQMGFVARLIESHGLRIESIAGGQAGKMVTVCRGATGENFAVMAAASEDDEKRSMLAHAIYVDRCAQALMKTPAQIPTRLDRDLMVLMRNANPPLDPFNTVLMRASSVLLLCETRDFMTQWSRWAVANAPLLNWYEQYTDLVERILKLLAIVDLSTSRMSLVFRDHESILSLKCCNIILRTGLINMYTLLAHGITDFESQHKVVSEAVMIASVSDTFATADYIVLEPILSMCWNLAKLVLGREQKRIKALGFPARRHNGPQPEIGVYAKHLPSLLSSLRMYTRMLILAVPYVKEEVPAGEDDVDMTDQDMAVQRT